MIRFAVVMPRVGEMTDTCTAVAHLVTDEAVAAGRQVGRYVGVCGAVVLPGSLTEDTNRYCRSCQLWYRELNSRVRETRRDDPGGALVERRATGDALNVLNTALTWGSRSLRRFRPAWR